MHTVRWWRLNDGIFPGGRATTGTPEGDAWSVVACIAISRFWCQLLNNQDAYPSAYADNWSWRARNFHVNRLAFQQTISYTNSLRIQIDWGKTWTWSTDSRNRQTWMNQMQSIFPEGTEMVTVTNARELGFTLNYNKTCSRATQRQRHAEAIKFMKQARQEHLTLATRAKLCSFALHKALWGTETYVVRMPWLRDLRANIAKTLVLHKGNSNPYLSCCMLSKFVNDPVVHLLQMCIRNLRAWLQFAEQDTFQSFLNIACRSSISHSQVWGPAGAFAYNLARINWHITREGVIHTDTNLQFHFLRDSQIDIFTQLEHSWMKHLTEVCLQRTEWKHLPIPDRQATLQLTKDGSPGEQRVWAELLTGASMTVEQMKHFTDETTCRLCNCPDSVYHRVMECAATAQVREEYASHMTVLFEHAPCHVQFPMVYQTEMHDFQHWYYQRVKPSDPDAQIFSEVQTDMSNGHTPSFYLDGTCDHPDLPEYRRTAYAVIYQRPVNEEEKHRAIREYRTNRRMPEHFAVLMVGEVRGSQTIDRAELTATIQVANLGIPANIFSDSQYVLDTVQKLRAVRRIHDLHKLPNFDLLLLLWPLVQQVGLVFHKIKAHALSPETDTFTDTWNKLGNAVADESAKTTLKLLQRRAPLHTDVFEHKQQLQWKRTHMRYLYDLQVMRARLFQQTEVAQPIGDNERTWYGQLELLKQWKPTEGFSYVEHEHDHDKIGASLWGSAYSAAILQWLKHVLWPDTQDTQGAGVTWIELALSFQYSVQKGVVINTGGTGAEFRPYHLSLNTVDTEFSRQVFAFERAATTLQTLLGRQLFPDRRAPAKSIRIMGASHARSGFSIRPSFPYQSTIIDSLSNHYRQLAMNPELSGGPTVPMLTPIVEWREDERDERDAAIGWGRRYSRYNRCRRRR